MFETYRYRRQRLLSDYTWMMDSEMEAEVTLAKCFVVVVVPLVACAGMCCQEDSQLDV